MNQQREGIGPDIASPATATSQADQAKTCLPSRVVRLEDLNAVAAECGFELAGATPAGPLPEAEWYMEWVRRGLGQGMGYLAGPRAQLRRDPRNLLPSARSVICVGKIYNTAYPYSVKAAKQGRAWISRYAWGQDYHRWMKRQLRRLARKIEEVLGRRIEWRAVVDSAPIMERALARRAGLGWIGKNSCLINQKHGSWIFLGELLVSEEIEPGQPVPDRCGSCSRCVEACPTGAIVPAMWAGGPTYTLDVRRCISFLTVENRGGIEGCLRGKVGWNLFGCDICQDVCPWNRRASVTGEEAFQPRHYAPKLSWLQALDERRFRAEFEGTPVIRASWEGFRRNLRVVLENQSADGQASRMAEGA